MFIDERLVSHGAYGIQTHIRFGKHWELRVVILTILLSLVAPEAIIMATCSVTADVKIGIMTTLSFQILNSQKISHFALISHIDGLVQDGSNSIADVLELLQFCSKPSICESWDVGCAMWKIIFLTRPDSWLANKNIKETTNYSFYNCDC